MIFVDTNVIMYAVGGQHPLRSRAQKFFLSSIKERSPLVTSAEVLQELLHAYIPVGRLATLDAALELVDSVVTVVWAVDRDDVLFARLLTDRHPSLGARDLLHLGCCRRRNVRSIETYDRALAAAFRKE